MGFHAAVEATPNTVNSTVARTREYLTGAEVEKLMAKARSSRWGHRDATMILIAYRHGLRACEVCDLQWHQVELATGRLHVRRSKRGTPSVHPLQGDEIRALRRLQREQAPGPHVFATERGGPMAPKSFESALACLSRSTLTCCATPAASRWRTPATIRAPSKLGSGTGTSSTRFAIPSWRRTGSRTSGVRRPRPQRNRYL